MIDLGKRNILGVQVNAVDYEGAVHQIADAAREGRPFGVSALAVHGVMTGVLDRTHRHRLNSLELVCPDGQPVRWALNRLHGAGLSDRVYGPNLTLKTCERAAADGLPVFLFGATPEILAAFENNLCKKYPALQIAGRRASEFRTLTSDERDALVTEIKASGARITLVGIGCPPQEVWVYEMKDALAMPVLAVGAAFAFHAGLLDQAPSWMQARGLEWFYRLIKEPTRLWRRYLYLNPLYASLAAAQWAKIWRPKTDDTTEPTSPILYG